MATNRLRVQIREHLKKQDPKVTNNVTAQQKADIKRAMLEIAKYGNGESVRIVANLLNGNVTFDVSTTALMGTSGTAGVADSQAATAAIAKGNLSESDALSLVTITIAKEEFSNPISVEANIIHEGSHAISQAIILASFSTKDPKNYQNETYYQSEYNAAGAAARYLRDRGNAHATYGIKISLISQTNGEVNTQTLDQKATSARNDFRKIVGANTNTFHDLFKFNGIKW